MKKILFYAIFFSTFSFSQSTAIDQLSELLESSSGSAGSLDVLVENGKDSYEYESFTQSRYSNLVNQIQRVDETEASSVFMESVRKQQLELAIRLCETDENACELVENYKNYKENKIEKNKKLEVFGVGLFYGYPLSFNQTESGGAPANYRLNIGDQVNLQIISSSPITANGFINSEGAIFIPNIGSVTIVGYTIAEAKLAIEQAAQSKLLGAQAILSLSSINTIQIYSLGLVNSPGAYKLSGTSKAINGIIASGGFKKNSSLRNIKIMRGNSIFKTIDLYDFLIRGMNGEDMYLRNDDTILITSKSNSVSISGEVGRPAIYEFKEGETFEDLLEFSLGFSEYADKQNISLKRKNSFGQYRTERVDVQSNFKLQNGDEILVGKAAGEWIDAISLVGSIRNVGEYQFSEGMSLGSLVKLDRDLLNDSYVPFISIKRFNENTRTYKFLSSDLLSQERLNSLLLKKGDQIFFFNTEDINFINSQTIPSYINGEIDKLISNNQEITIEVDCLSSILNFSGDEFLESAQLKYEIASNSELLSCTEIFNNQPLLVPILVNRAIPVFGDIILPGIYPTSSEVSAEQMLQIAGGEIYSYESAYKYQIGSFDLQQASNEYNLDVKNLKYIGVNGVSSVASESYITLVGEFKFPGKYKISLNTTLLDIFDMAGGLTDQAFPHGGILSRQSILKKEEELLKQSEKELSDIIATGVTSGVIKQSSSDLLGLVSIIKELGAIEPTGRIVTEFEPAILKRDQNKNIYIKNGDVIYMPRVSNTVTIAGSVLNPITVPYNPKFSLDDYIEMTGGYTDASSKEKTFIILANGQSVQGHQFSLFGRHDNGIRPGSTIIVPRSARPLEGLSFVEAITPILANLSITMASIVSITDRN